MVQSAAPDSLTFVFSDESLDALRRFFYVETGITSSARVSVGVLLLHAHKEGIALEDVLMSFRRHNTAWSLQEEELRGNLSQCTFAKANQEVFRAVCTELKLTVPDGLF